MAESNYHQAGLQHLAFLQQTQRQSPTAGGHNPWAAEVGLEAHLVQRQQQALAAIQDLERQRLQPKLSQDSAENPPL